MLTMDHGKILNTLPCQLDLIFELDHEHVLSQGVWPTL